MNLTSLESRLRARIGNPTTADVPDATLDIAINEAYTDIWDKYRFYANRALDTSITTIASTNGYVIPTTVDVMFSVRDTTNKVRLDPMDKVTWDGLNQTSTGKPTRFFRDGYTLYFDPIPDGAYAITLRHKKSITELATGSDSPAIPTSWHNGLLLLSRYKYWDGVGNWQMAQAALGSWAEWVEDKTDEIDEETFYMAEIGLSPSTLSKPLNRLDFDHSDG